MGATGTNSLFYTAGLAVVRLIPRCRGGQLIATVVVRVAGMALGPRPRGFVAFYLFIQFFPEVLIHDGLLRGQFSQRGQQPQNDPLLRASIRHGDSDTIGCHRRAKQSQEWDCVDQRQEQRLIPGSKTALG